MWSESAAASFHGLMTLSTRSIRHLHARNDLFGSIVAAFVTFGLGEDTEKGGVARCDPLAEGEASDEYGNTGDETVEKIEGANCADTDEIEEGALDAKICEGLVQAFEDPVPPAGCGVCLHRKALTLDGLNG